MKAKVRILDVYSGRYSVFINAEEAEKAKLHPDDLVKIESGKKTVFGSLVISDLVGPEEVGVSRDVLQLHNLAEGEVVSVSPAGIPESVRYIKKKMHGEKLRKVEIEAIVRDIVDRKLRDIEISSFVTSLEINGLDMDEIACLLYTSPSPRD
jgi:AMP phosphorylase